MPQPYNYSLNVPNPADALTRGLQTGVQIGEVQAQTALRNQQAQALQAKAQRQQQFQQAIGGLGANPSAKQLSGLLVQFPEMSNLFKESYDRLDKQEQTERTSQASSVYSAVLAGDNDLAKSQLTEYATAYRNAGREDEAKALETKAKLIDLHPDAAEKGIALYLAQTMGPEKFAETFGKLQDQRRATSKEGAELSKVEAEAKSAAAKAQFADSEAVLDLQKKGWDIEKIQNDIGVSRQNVKIATMNAALARETNDLKKQELKLKIDDAKEKRDATVRTRQADAEAGRAVTDNLISSVDELLKVPLGDLKAITGTYDSKTPTLLPGSAKLEGLLETIQNQVALGNLDKLKGPTSDRDIVFLKAAIRNLKQNQGAESLRKNLEEIKRLSLKSRGQFATRYGVPETTPDTPSAASGADSDETNRLVGGANSGGATARY